MKVTTVTAFRCRLAIADSRLVYKEIMIIVVAEVTIVLNFFIILDSLDVLKLLFSFAQINFMQLKVHYIMFEWIAATQN